MILTIIFLHFLCTVSVPPMPKVVWYKDDKIIREGPRYKFSQEGGTFTLEIQETTEEDAGEYHAEVSNVIGTSTTKCKLAVDGE